MINQGLPLSLSPSLGVTVQHPRSAKSPLSAGAEREPLLLGSDVVGDDCHYCTCPQSPKDQSLCQASVFCLVCNTMGTAFRATETTETF